LVVKANNPADHKNKIKLLTNYLPVVVPRGPFCQYHVHFSPEVDSARLGNYLLMQHKDTLFKDMAFVFDGLAVLYTKYPIRKNLEEKIELVSKGRKLSYKITIQNTAYLENHKTIKEPVRQLFNIMYRTALRRLRLQQIGRNHYNMEQAIPLEVYNLRIVPGLLETICLTGNGILFNADIIYRSLRTDTVLDLIYDYKKRYGNKYKKKVEAELVGSTVLCLYNNRTVYINAIAWDKTPKDSFERKEGKITYLKYFKEVHSKTINDQDQPLLLRKRKDRVEYYIPELCTLTGITDDMRKDFKCMQQMKRATFLNPHERAGRILEFVQKSSENTEFTEALSKWDFEIQPKLVEVQGAILDKETIIFGEGAMMKSDDRAQWRIRDQPLYKNEQVNEWLLIKPPDCEYEVDRLLKSLYKVSSPLGISLKGVKQVTTKGDYPKDYEECIRANLKSKNNFKFVLVILPDKDKGRYDEVKKLLCLEYGTLSQCIALNTMQGKALDSIATKVAIQIATKIGAIPWTVDLPLPGPTMICGMDVYHSGEKVTRTKSSIVGFTANLGGSDSSYYSRVLINKPGEELVESLEPCIEEALVEFKKKNKVSPKYVIFYRDGVGEGQVPEVKDKEVKSIQKVIEKVGAKLCFIVVLKRIHTRLFRKEGNSILNPAPGTVVDTGITEPGCLEFFMISQNVGQGTATPVRYQCIHNSAKLGPTYLQSLTFKLTHLYYNWFGTIKVPAPCLYAHRLAFLVGQSLKREDDEKRLCTKLYYL